MVSRISTFPSCVLTVLCRVLWGCAACLSLCGWPFALETGFQASGMNMYGREKLDNNGWSYYRKMVEHLAARSFQPHSSCYIRGASWQHFTISSSQERVWRKKKKHTDLCGSLLLLSLLNTPECWHRTLDRAPKQRRILLECSLIPRWREKTWLYNYS